MRETALDVALNTLAFIGILAGLFFLYCLTA